VDGPALEPNTGEQGRDPTKIIGPDAMPLHRSEDLDQHSRTITAGGEHFQIVQPGHSSDHRTIAYQLACKLARCVPWIQDHHIAWECLPHDGDLRGNADRDCVSAELG
jgi:hypothetical protein